MEWIIHRLDDLSRANVSLARSNRRLRLGVAGGSVALGLALLVGATSSPKSLESSHFVLRDEAGKMRAALAIRPDETPGLGFFDSDGQLRLSLDLGPNGPAVNLMSQIGKPQAALALRRDGTPGLGLFDPTGQPRLSMDITRSGDPAVNLNGAEGLVRAALAIRADGTPGLGLFDAEGRLQKSFENPEAPDGPLAERDDIH
jgi:hypothetical protein